MKDESIQKLMDILSGRGIEVSVVNSDSEIMQDGFYFLMREDRQGIDQLGIDHWSKAASHKLKVANEHGLYSDGFISMADAEDIEVFLDRMEVWNDWLNRNTKK